MREKKGDNNQDRHVAECICCGAKHPQVHGLWCVECWNELEQTREFVRPESRLKPDRRESAGGK